jgi:uncharacterized membrane protein
MFDLHLLIRYVHVAAMALMLGGPLLLWWLAGRAIDTEADTHERLLLLGAQRYEWLFWFALGVSVMTGVGNLGTFGLALPGPASAWGMKFSAKIGLVLLFILLSLVRTLLITSTNTEPAKAPRSRRAMVRNVYGGTAVSVLVILFLAVSLAHGG